MSEQRTSPYWLLPLLAFTLSSLPRAPSQGYMHSLAPFFFQCHYHGTSDQSNLDSGEVALSVTIEGNPDYYKPSQAYKVTITSSRDFDGFMLTGLYTVESKFAVFPSNTIPSIAMAGNDPFGKMFHCTVVHSQATPKPQHRLSFFWMAPPAGTGCVSFLATAKRNEQILFKDTTVLQLCEEGGAGLPPSRPVLSTLHEEGITMRDDFDSYSSFNSELWSSVEGVVLGDKCGTVLHGKSAVACEKVGSRKMVTVPLNMTSASVLQFAIASGICEPAESWVKITIFYATGDCSSWTPLEIIRAPTEGGTSIHIVHIPKKVRTESTCIKWDQWIAASHQEHTGCWAMDNVLINNLAEPPVMLQENFDPLETSNWLFFPGARIRHKCHSDNHALVFHGEDQLYHFATSRDVNLQQENLETLLEEPFDTVAMEGWTVAGGHVGSDCDIIHRGSSMIFSGSSQTRLLCSPFLDLSEAANVRFHFGYGVGGCLANRDTSRKVFVYTDDEFDHSTMLRDLSIKGYQEPKLVSIVIPPRARNPKTRICWAQKTHRGEGQDVWAIDTIQVLTYHPTQPQRFAQFRLNMHCGVHAENNSMVFEFSTDHGYHWDPLYDPCYHDNCPGKVHTKSSFFKGTEADGWLHILMPLPHAALTKYTRFRWKQLTHSQPSSWAIDNVFLGLCEEGCNGHGYCTEKGCICNIGFDGPTCALTSAPLPSLMIDTMTSIESIKMNFAMTRGASLSYACGVVGSGKAVVFYRDGPRQIQTVDLNTTNIRYMQFSVRVGSDSDVGSCPSPGSEEEGVLLHYTCTGGLTWKLLKELKPGDYRQPKVVSIQLPDDAKQQVCRFRWWQPLHSGQGKDVWAMDDVALTSKLYNTIQLNFSSSKEVEQAVDVHLGKLDRYCQRWDTLSFTEPYQEGEYRYLVTDSMQIGPSYMLQFELVMGCSHHFVSDLDNKVYLEYSVDHGMNWDLIRKGCWPPKMCVEHHSPTVFYSSQFQNWQRITILLPASTWSSSTRIRFRQSRWTNSDSWAIDNLYIGQQCPALCNGHGRCVDSICLCDPGYYGDTCIPRDPLPSSLKTDFSMMSHLDSNWLAILGGSVAGANQGCGTMLSGESLYFSKGGPRMLISRDLNTVETDYLQFYAQVGGENDLQCMGVDRQEENVLVQYSNDGGITWHLLKELQSADYYTPRFVHIDLPEDAKTPSLRFRWWQPVHSGQGMDQWAVDEIVVGSYQDMRDFQDDFQSDQAVSTDDNMWLIITEGMYALYCQSQDETLMFANQNNDKIAVTKDLQLKAERDIIQFRINVGCSKSFSFHHPVLFQYSHDSGVTWELVQKPCYLDDQCHEQYSEGSIYYTGTYGEWRLVVIKVTNHIAAGRVNFRWWQKGGPTSSFALDDIYIGPACLHMCSGHGICIKGQCKCDDGYGEVDCHPLSDEPRGLVDRFDDMNRPTELWGQILGGYLGTGCGIIGGGNSLYFDEDGTREARTVPLNLIHIRMLQFMIRIGSVDDDRGCRKPQNRNEGVIIDFSIDNGITWTVLRVLDPETSSIEPQIVTIQLPPEAKTPSTIIRWWQPIISPGNQRAEWAMDNVIIAVNDTSSYGFQENFNPMHNEIWYMAMNAVPKITCSSEDDALEFSKNGRMRYAETWDYQVNPSTFLQFDIAMGCSGTYSTLYSVMLQYSVDMGHHWYPVQDECLPPKLDCSGYHLSSDFISEAHANWTRVTLYLPPGAVSPATRFRWLQETVTLRGNVWALDNVYLGDGCPWMCSGHGSCKHGVCVCDHGYFGIYCVPAIQLPMTLKDDFNNQYMDKRKWPEVYGGEVSNICGMLISSTALTFYKENLRMVVTRDLDVSMSMFVQFTFQYGCQYDSSDWPREHAVLLQFSNNGGILWQLLKEIHYKNYGEPKFISIQIPTPAQTNSTRFRLWQPQHDGHMKSVWAVDNFYIGGSMMNPERLYETFDIEPSPDDWLFWPGGKSDRFCSFSTGPDTILAGSSAIVFGKGPGEHSVTTRDLSVNELSVIQFDINVGCSPKTSERHPVRLEYSTDQGKSWYLLVPACTQDSLPTCADSKSDSTVYFSGATQFWRRIIVPLRDLRICGTARFRWYQGYFTSKDADIPLWAVDNVYIGMQCRDHCSGHGTCINGVYCQCDENFQGQQCMAIRRHLAYLKEDFEIVTNTPYLLDTTKWLYHSGADKTEKCGLLLSGSSLHFTDSGVRILVTTDLDLTLARVIQFIIKLGCGNIAPVPQSEPVLLQYSKNGGVTWNTIEQFSFSKSSNQPQYIAIHVPHGARTNATRVRWWQSTVDGTYLEEWAIDQIYIGGDINGRMVLQDDLFSTERNNWLLYPGGEVERTCGSPYNSLHFAGHDPVRYAVTGDVTVVPSTYLMFYLAAGCSYTGKCYGIELQYSLDLGKTWQILERECMPSMVDCISYHSNSVFTSDVYYGWNRITIHLPYYTRSKSTRFRWIQHGGFEPSNTWALAQVYLGDECDCSCAGHGRCDRGTCICDPGWTGMTCSEPSSPLPTFLKDNFDALPDKAKWSQINGATVSNKCGVLASGTALHFKGDCTRQVITTDLDLRNATFVQFHFLFGCVALPTNRDEGVIMDYSTNGGVTWNKMIELYYDQYRKPSYISVELPPEARMNGVRIRWWQPHHGGLSISDWAIDNLVIGGNDYNPDDLKDDFEEGPTKPIWLETDNIHKEEYCGKKDALSGEAKTKEDVLLTTTDLRIREDYILQFSISVGCNASWDADVSPVHLEYSTDYGITWKHLVQECLPFYPQCNGQATTPTIYYATPGWRRETIPLEGPVISRATRFRWHQSLRDSTHKGTKQHWAVDDVYIGPACRNLCNGHGRCDYPNCICDEGYGGETCIQTTPIKTYLKDTFNNGVVNPSDWLLTQGGHIGTGCMVLVDGTGLHFIGYGQRQAITRDLDLRNARFIQYHAMIGGPSTKTECGTPKSRNESVVLQYSVNGGITWHTLHILDHRSYWSQPQHDYIPLPLHARTNSTRVRWWQLLGLEDSHPMGWTLDNVYIGGSEINPSSLYEDFEDAVDETVWEFYPNGKLWSGLCSRRSSAMAWNGNPGLQSLTTGQLIVQEGYMLQFKIMVGCGEPAYNCDSLQSVLLQFNKDPSTDSWDLVFPRCLMNEHENNMECRPYRFHQGTMYTANTHSGWTRVTMLLPAKVFSGNTRFRWIQQQTDRESPSWALDDVYVGEKCLNLCNGRGDCINGQCACDRDYIGETCEPVRSRLLSHMTDGFEGGISPLNWESINGGALGLGCGTLLPLAHGKNLYFSSCGIRQAVTTEMDVSKASKIMFVLQIGSHRQSSTCNVNLAAGPDRGMVVLQYTLNKGIDWTLLATHEPKEFLTPKRIGYEIPEEARTFGVQFRWWQPEHGGVGHDQWAIDHVEIIMTRQDHMLQTMKRENFQRFDLMADRPGS